MLQVRGSELVRDWIHLQMAVRDHDRQLLQRTPPKDRAGILATSRAGLPSVARIGGTGFPWRDGDIGTKPGSGPSSCKNQRSTTRRRTAPPRSIRITDYLS